MTYVNYDRTLAYPGTHGQDPSMLRGAQIRVNSGYDFPANVHRGYERAPGRHTITRPGAMTPKTTYGRPPTEAEVAYVSDEMGEEMRQEVRARGPAGSRMPFRAAMPYDVGIPWGKRMAFKDSPAKFAMDMSMATLGIRGLMGLANRAVAQREAYRGPVKPGIQHTSPSMVIATGGRKTMHTLQGLPGSPRYAGTNLGRMVAGRRPHPHLRGPRTAAPGLADNPMSQVQNLLTGESVPFSGGSVPSIPASSQPSVGVEFFDTATPGPSAPDPYSPAPMQSVPVPTQQYALPPHHATPIDSVALNINIPQVAMDPLSQQPVIIPASDGGGRMVGLAILAAAALWFFGRKR